MARDDAERWDRRHAHAPAGEPAGVVLRMAARFPAPARCIDLACGRGANALHLAARGWTVDAIDVSGVALAALAIEADRRGLAGRIRPIRMDLDRPALRQDAARHALCLCISFLERRLLARAPGLLLPGGQLLFETFHEGYLAVRPDFRREWLLGRGEAATLFPALEIVERGEDATRAFVLARKPLEDA